MQWQLHMSIMQLLTTCWPTPSSQYNCPPTTTLVARQVTTTRTTTQPTLWPSVWCHMVWNDPWTNSELLSWLCLALCCSIMKLATLPHMVAWLGSCCVPITQKQWKYWCAVNAVSVKSVILTNIYTVFYCHSWVAISTYQYNSIHFWPLGWAGIDFFLFYA